MFQIYELGYKDALTAGLYFLLLNVPSVSIQYFNNIKRTPPLGK